LNPQNLESQSRTSTNSVIVTPNTSLKLLCDKTFCASPQDRTEIVEIMSFLHYLYAKEAQNVLK
jgi:hypothetical protein